MAILRSVCYQYVHRGSGAKIIARGQIAGDPARFAIIGGREVRCLSPKPYVCGAWLAAALMAAFSDRPLIAAETDREVAIWALHMGGFVVLEGDSRRIRDVAELPQRDFRIETLNLVGSNIHPPHMEAIGKLTALKELDLPGTMWNPRAESKTDYHDSASYLNGLTTLKNLTFSFTFLISIHFEDPGLDKFQALGPTLEELVLRRALIKGPGLRHFTNLRALDLTWSYVEDGSMQSLAGMTKLRRFWARDTDRKSVV